MINAQTSDLTGSMSAAIASREALGVSPQEMVQVIMCNASRRPLWPVKLVEEFFDYTNDQVVANIKGRKFSYVFDIGLSARRPEYRILAWCVLEKTMSQFREIGATQNLQLSQVFNLILPRGNIRSPDLKRIFCCSKQQVSRLADNFKMVTKPDRHKARQGYAVFDRTSIAYFLEKRRVT